MIDSTPSSGSSTSASDARLELTVAAAAAERANRPRWIILLGCALLLISVIYALTQLSARATMFGKIAGERAQTRKVLDLKNSIESETLALAKRGTTPDPRAGGKVEGYALQTGVTLSGAVTDTTRSANSAINMQQHVYTAKAINQEPLAVLNWLNTIQSQYETTGLEMTRLRLTPGGATTSGTAGWNVDLELARWEKTK
jgi:hypothetical protein